MPTLLVGFAWLAALGIALFASEQLVKQLTVVSAHFRFAPPLVGLLVAAGADAPEVTSALLATAGGNRDIGAGVIVGSNLYNLAGLLGLAALIASRVPTGASLLTLDRGTNLVLTALLMLLVFVPAAHGLLGIALIAVLGIYAWLEARAAARPPAAQPIPAAHPAFRGGPRSAVVLVVAVAGIAAGSGVLVNTSVTLGPEIGVPREVLATFVLPIATSLPNTWAAVSLARRRLAEAAIASTFNSNSINAALGAGIPALFGSLSSGYAVHVLDVPWLAVMTLVAVVLVASRHELRAWEGSLLIALYACYALLRLTVFAGHA